MAAAPGDIVDDILAHLKLRVEKCPLDGDCFYHAINTIEAKETKKQSSAEDLRNELATYFEKIYKRHTKNMEEILKVRHRLNALQQNLVHS